MPKITIQKVDKDNWEDVFYFEATSNSRLFTAFANEAEVKKYMSESIIYFILLDGKRVGTISYERKEDSEVEFNGLIVHPDYRGRGIAKEAMNVLMAEIGNTGRIFLYTHPENAAALNIYMRHGFRIKKWCDNHFGDGEPRLMLERISRSN